MVELPTPRIVTTFPAIVATSVFELVYVSRPLLLVVGFIKVKGAVPIILGGIKKLLKNTTLGFT